MRTSFAAGFVLIGSLAPLLPRMAHAQEAFQDPRGRFAIDLPPGFELSGEQPGRFYIFQVPEARLLVSVVPGARDPDRLWQSALDDFTGAGVPPPAAESVADLEVNGNPARIAWYGFDSGEDQAKVPYTVMLGTVLLRESGTGVVCFCLLNERAADRWGDHLRKAFGSIRVPGAPVISEL